VCRRQAVQAEGKLPHKTGLPYGALLEFGAKDITILQKMTTGFMMSWHTLY